MKGTAGATRCVARDLQICRSEMGDPAGRPYNPAAEIALWVMVTRIACFLHGRRFVRIDYLDNIQ